MENKVKLKICVGTYCYVMGGHDLKEIKNQLPSDLRDKVYVEASVCLGCDKLTSDPQPPYAEIDGQLIPQASVEKIISKLREMQNS
jgi:NADH:ubiquinone oxidoreductase subunit E